MVYFSTCWSYPWLYYLPYIYFSLIPIPLAVYFILLCCLYYSKPLLSTWQMGLSVTEF